MRIIFTLLFVSLFISCSKSPNEINGQATLTDTAKSWWNAQNFQSTLVFSVDWEAAENPVTIDGVRILEVPIRYPSNLLGEINALRPLGEKKADSLYTYRSLIIYHHPQKGFYYGVMKLVGTENYNTKVAVKKNSFVNLSNNFEGLFILERLDGTFITGARYKWGAKPVQIRLKPKGPMTELYICDQVTTNFYSQACVGGQCGPVRLVSSSTYLENCQWYPEGGEEEAIDFKWPPDGGGGYNPPTETEINEVQIIKNNLTDTCHKDVVNDIVNGDWSSAIVRKVNDYFGYQRKITNITFKDASQYQVDYPEDGPLPSHIQAGTRASRPNGITLEVNIYFNKMQSASREYIGLIAIHEIMHGIYAYENGFNSNSMDHGQMVGYLNILSGTLREMYPSLTSTQAYALSLEGLSKTPYGAMLKLLYPEVWSRNIEIIDSYRFGTAGTKCRN